jgi:ROS/MUCR transcriptional regulator protein
LHFCFDSRPDGRAEGASLSPALPLTSGQVPCLPKLSVCFIQHRDDQAEAGRGGACRRTGTVGAAVGRRAHNRDRRRLRRQEHHRRARSGRSDRCGQPRFGRSPRPRAGRAGQTGANRASAPLDSRRAPHVSVCGQQQKTLRRHLDVAHRLTPEAYREQFGLKPDYPMAAPGYSRQRSEMAKRTGLGQRVQATARTWKPRGGA